MSSSSSAPSGRAPRQARSEETRAELIRAVLRLLVREGREAITHRAVAREAGVSLSATSYYFASRDAMLAAAYQSHADAIRAEIDAVVEKHGWRARRGEREPLDAEGIGRVFSALVYQQLAERSDGFFATLELQLASARDPELRAQLGDWRRHVRRFTRDLMRRAGSRHPGEDAELLGALVNGLALEHLAAGGGRRRARRLANRAGHFVAQVLKSETD